MIIGFLVFSTLELLNLIIALWEKHRRISLQVVAFQTNILTDILKVIKKAEPQDPAFFYSVKLSQLRCIFVEGTQSSSSKRVP